jgi:acyl-CoA thioesterase-1
MGDDIVIYLKTDGRATRRAWLTHCTVVAVAAWFAGLAPAAAQGPTVAARPAAGGPVLVLGDSLSAEYGLPRGSGWVALLQDRLDRERPGVRVVNASVSGDTTSGGRSRLPPLLAQHRPSVVVIELGGNDALRGLPLAMTEENLTAMTRAAQGAGARVVLAGMQVPPNYGRRYGEDFFALFARVARAERVSLVPFLLKGVADDAARAEQLFQADRIHPTAAAHPIMLDNVWPVLRPLLK